MGPHALADASSVINLNHPGTYLNSSFIDISVANLAVIAVMVVIFGLALLVPFPRTHSAQLADPAAGTLAGTPDTAPPIPQRRPPLTILMPICGRPRRGGSPSGCSRPASCFRTGSRR
jgi:hypothetical protein